MRYKDERIEKLEQQIEALLARVESLEAPTGRRRQEGRAGFAGAAESQRRHAARLTSQLAVLSPEAPPPAPPASAPPAPPRAAPAKPPQAPKRRPSVDLEELLGPRVLAWLGAVAVVLGVSFFLATAIRRGWIDEATRVALAYLGSTVLLAVGLYLHERQGRTQAALAAVAAALAGLYASTTAATQLYELVDPVVGLGVAGLIGAVGTAIAVRFESKVVAGVGLVGALLAPVLVDAGTTGGALAFMGIALVSAVGVLLWQRWDWLAAAAFLTSAPQLLFWVEDTYRDDLVTTLVVLGLFWIVYAVAAIGYELRVPTERLRLSSASLLLVDGIMTSGVGWLVLDDTGHGNAATAWIVGAALVHVVLGFATVRGRVSREIALLALAIGIGLSAIAAALAVDGPALVAAWSVEAVLLTWLARHTGERRGYLFAAGFLSLAAAHTLLLDAPPDGLAADPVRSGTVAVALVIVAAAAASRLYAGPWPEGRLFAEGVALAGLAYLPPTALEGLPVVAAWVAIAVALGLLVRLGWIGEAGVVAPAYLALAAAHVLAFEAPPTALREGVDDLAVGLAGILLVTAGAATLLRLRQWPSALRDALEATLAVGSIYVASVAIVDLTATGEPFEPGQTPQVLLSAFWSLAGLAALVVGLMRDDRRLRLGGLGLLGVAAVKVFLYDLAELDEIYRVLSFVALGLLLLAGAFAYQRIRHTVGSDA